MKNKIFAVLETSAMYLALAYCIQKVLPILFPGTHIEMDWYNFRWVFLGFAFTFSVVLNYNEKTKPKKVETMFIDRNFGFVTSKQKLVDINPGDTIYLKNRKYKVWDISTETIYNDDEHSSLRQIYVDEVRY